MQPHIQQSIVDAEELRVKINELIAFKKTDMFAKLDSKERERMSNQQHHMIYYHKILLERVDAARDKEHS